MEKIKDLSLDTDEQLLPTLAAFKPLLEKNEKKINSVPKQSFKFGETDRHFLDIYYPTSATVTGGKAPVLFFIYGGGFISGSRNAEPPLHPLYSSVGAFFALQGFITILPDYRLAPEFKYPKAAEDILTAINWATSHASDLVLGSSPSPDLDSLFISGHSAGAVHSATLLYHQGLIPVGSDLRRKIKGVVVMGGPGHFLPGAGRKEMAEAHWGSEANAAENAPTPLLLSWISNGCGTNLPKVLIVQGENEPRWVYDTTIDHKRLLEWYLGESVAYVEGKGHNHVSFICCLSSGEGEEWGTEAASWIRDVHRDGKSGVASTGVSSILKDLEETEAYECPKCLKRKTRSFEIELGTQQITSKVRVPAKPRYSWTNVSLIFILSAENIWHNPKSFASCSNCGNKWSW